MNENLGFEFGSIPDEHSWGISPYMEMGAYEALWAARTSSFKTIADLIRKRPGGKPSDFVKPSEAEDYAERVLKYFRDRKVIDFGLRIHGSQDYPEKLRDSSNPVEVLYYQGLWKILETKCVSIVGSRKASPEGVRRARKLSKRLVQDGFTIISGLATGIDHAAHTAAIEAGGNTVGVIGTPLGDYYPKEHRQLQESIAKEHLLISQVPVVRYQSQDWRQNRLFFPERNVTMSALSKATVIVEASDTSGTLTQAKAALKQNRKLFILNNCFEKTTIKWPAKFEALGAIRIHEFEDIIAHLQ